MKHACLSLLFVVGCAGCAPPAAVQPESPGPKISGNGRCDAGKVAWAIGQTADKDTMARVWRESGAGLIRPVAPGQAMTRDYRPDRVNVYIDAGNTITKVNCG